MLGDHLTASLDSLKYTNPLPAGYGWEMELKIKRDKSIGGLDTLPNFRPDTIHAWLCAKLLAQQIAHRLTTPQVAFPPSAVGRCALPLPAQAA